MSSTTPLTITMMLQAAVAQSGYGADLVDGRYVTNIQAVAAVRTIDDVPHSQDKIIQIEDGTGLISVVTDEGTHMENHLRSTINIYVAVTGHLIKHGRQTMVKATSVREVDDPNRITYHFLDVVYEGEKYKARRAKEAAAAAAQEVASGSAKASANAFEDSLDEWPFDD